MFQGAGWKTLSEDGMCVAVVTKLLHSLCGSQSCRAGLGGIAVVIKLLYSLCGSQSSWVGLGGIAVVIKLLCSLCGSQSSWVGLGIKCLVSEIRLAGRLCRKLQIKCLEDLCMQLMIELVHNELTIDAMFRAVVVDLVAFLTEELTVGQVQSQFKLRARPELEKVS